MTLRGFRSRQALFAQHPDGVGSRSEPRERTTGTLASQRVRNDHALRPPDALISDEPSKIGAHDVGGVWQVHETNNGFAAGGGMRRRE